MDNPLSVVDSEWTTRCELAALYRLVAHFRMTDMIDTHISARVPGYQDQCLINRYGVMFHEMRASDLVKIDHQCTPAPKTQAQLGQGAVVDHPSMVDQDHALA